MIWIVDVNIEEFGDFMQNLEGKIGNEMEGKICYLCCINFLFW